MKKYIIWFLVGVVLWVVGSYIPSDGCGFSPCGKQDFYRIFLIGSAFVIFAAVIIVAIFKPLLDKTRKGLGSLAEKAKDSYTENTKNKN